jgi:hypothetical protein
MLQIISDYVRVKNGDTRPRAVVDPRLPMGRLVLQPGEETEIPRATYRRVLYLTQDWLVNLDSPTVSAAIEETAPAASSE